MIEIVRTHEIGLCHALRRTVFIDEQGVSEAEEMDDLDGEAIHLLARVNGVPQGTARLLIVGEIGKIGRVCVLKSARGIGLGAALMTAALAELRKHKGVSTAKLSAQTHAIGFYERLGFTAYGAEYQDAGIAHRDMICPLFPASS